MLLNQDIWNPCGVPNGLILNCIYTTEVINGNIVDST